LHQVFSICFLVNNMNANLCEQAVHPRETELALNTAGADARPPNPKHRSIFISRASADFKLADEIRQLLEERGTNCWIAPRDIPPSSSYGEEISKALDACSMTVLILTEQSNASKPVSNEIEMSFSKQKRNYSARSEAVHWNQAKRG
jgi:hypothetical protein